ncbi:MAG: hypothetical protein K2X74_17645, partial [Acetobacteraceae bacterium]|nr:hypothetical protein [Acetobacteraceae bacterium]
MTRIQLLSAAALGAAMMAGPALAQPGGAINEMRREQAGPGPSWVPEQNRLAAEADSMGRQEASRWLGQAEEALRRGRMGEANELLERAETRLLTRSTPAPMADQPYQGPVVDRIAAARRALMERDRSGASQSIAAARSILTNGADIAAGSGGGMAPAQGGGMMHDRGMGSGGMMHDRGMGSGGMMHDRGMGSGAMMHDRGMGSSTMSRADAVGELPQAQGSFTLAQGGGGGGGGGGMGEGSGGLQGSSRGSPGTGMQGSTPAVRPETPQQPG